MTWRAPARLLIHGQLWQGLRGIFRRDPVLERSLFLQQTLGTQSADLVWVYALASQGRFHWTPETTVLKRFYAGSTHAQWTTHTQRHTLSELVALKPLLVDSARGAGAKAQGTWLLGIWGVVRFGGDVLWMLRRHSHLHARFQRVLGALLAPPSWAGS